MQLGVADPLGSQTASFERQQRELRTRVAELQRDIQGLQSLQYLTPEQEFELQVLKFDLEEARKAVREHADEHVRATRVILFNLMAQRVAAGENSAEQIELLGMVAEAWGIMGEGTVTAIQGIDRALELSKSNMEAARQEILKIGDAALAVSGDYYIRFLIETQSLDDRDLLTERRPDPSVFARDIEQRLRPSMFPQLRMPSGGGGRAAGGTAIPEREVPLIEKLMAVGGALSQIGSLAISAVQRDVIDPLQKQITAIDALMRPGFIDITARERTLELEQDRAEAAERVADAQARILELQKQQERLSFLEAQIRLLDLIREHELDSADLLGGLKLGIDANMLDVIDATVRAMSQLVDKAEKELGVSSPSWKFAEMGRFSAMGLEKGWLDYIGNVKRSMDTSIQAILPDGRMIVGTGDTSPLRQPYDERRPAEQVQTIEVNLNVDNINSQLDIEYVARRVAETIKYRMQ